MTPRKEREVKTEHVALNVSDPVAMAAWYREHLGFEIAKSSTTPPFTTFLRESSGVMMIEIYRNPPDQVPSYFDMNPLQLHLAFVSVDPEADKSRLLAAGATLAKDEHLPDGSHPITLRDPWGLAIQLCKRSTPLLKFK